MASKRINIHCYAACLMPTGCFTTEPQISKAGGEPWGVLILPLLNTCVIYFPFMYLYSTVLEELVLL